MKITVCIKQVPGTTQVEIEEETGNLIRDGIDSKMNPYDLYALETALKIKEETGAETTAVSMGPPQAEEIIKEAYMMGIDNGRLYSDRKFAGSDVLATAYTLAQGIESVEIPDIIICGKMTTDGDTAQVGPEIAEFLNIPHITNVLSIIEIKDDSIVVEVDMPETVDVAEIKFPCLITVEKGIFQPRLPSYRLKQKTKDKGVSVYSLENYNDKNENHYGLSGSPTQVVRIFPPDPNTDHEILSGDGEKIAETLFSKLEEMKYI
ncbi:MAG: electron transfer flavoprotein subunit beta/FixA family protein [Thermodesulfobacteriota bacterium]